MNSIKFLPISSTARQGQGSSRSVKKRSNSSFKPNPVFFANTTINPLFLPN